MDREEGGESDMELDLLVESDSDSDGNQSGVDNASTQRSVQTGATAGSDADDDSADTSAGEDEDDPSEAAETDEFESGDFFSDEHLERRVNAAISCRSVAPQNLQWAIRPTRDNASSRTTGGVGSAVGGPIATSSTMTTSGIYIDPTTLRRGPTCASSVGTSFQEPVSLSSTNCTLARAFAIVVRQICSLINIACEAVRDGSSLRSAGFYSQNLTASLVISLLRHLDSRLQPTWDWLFTLMDSTESQLRYVCLFFSL